MADPILHIKDAYFFEVPKFLWRAEYQSKYDVPKFLLDAHPEATVEEFNHALSGKILIPQPFGTLKNLFERESGFCISKFMIIEVVVAILLVAIFSRVAARTKTGAAPRGRFMNFFEGMAEFVREKIAHPAIGHHDADRFAPVLMTLFFFILGCNLAGMVPWVGSPTGSFGVTLALACATFATVLVGGTMKFGPVGFWLNQVPHMDLPWYCWPLKPAIFLIEVMGLLIKHSILAVRLLANMVAGHLVLLAIMGLIVGAAKASTGTWATVTTLSVVGCTLLSILELFVAFLQAYVFTFLSALFIGAAVHHH